MKLLYFVSFLQKVTLNLILPYENIFFKKNPNQQQEEEEEL